MTSYSYSLRCVSLTPSDETEGDVDVVLRESNAVYFAGLNGIPSEQFGIKHTFTLRSFGGDRWRIVSHVSDDNPYYSADYDPVTRQDKNFPAITDYIEARRALPREGLMVDASADHPYDRQAAREYMLAYVGRRNPGFMAYDDYGGNCMNFGSQVLLAGGIPMDTRWRLRNGLVLVRPAQRHPALGQRGLVLGVRRGGAGARSGGGGQRALFQRRDRRHHHHGRG